MERIGKRCILDTGGVGWGICRRKPLRGPKNRVSGNIKKDLTYFGREKNGVDICSSGKDRWSALVYMA
jgi:hypothetical protein